MKEGERSTQVVGYGQRQRALSSHVNRYWERKSVLTLGYFFEIVETEKVYAGVVDERCEPSNSLYCNYLRYMQGGVYEC